MKTLVHGDDYFSGGTRESLDWLQQALEKEYYIKTQRISNRRGCSLDGKVLNRIVIWVVDGYELEGDPRHGELVVEQLDLVDAAP